MLNSVFFSIGGFVWAIALFKRELLIRKESFRVILATSAVLFVIGLALHFSKAVGNAYYGALLSPLLSLALFRLFRKSFLRRYSREPMDIFLRWEKGLDEDRIFNIVYFILAGLLLMFSAAIVE